MKTKVSGLIKRAYSGNGLLVPFAWPLGHGVGSKLS